MYCAMKTYHCVTNIVCKQTYKTCLLTSHSGAPSVVMDATFEVSISREENSLIAALHILAWLVRSGSVRRATISSHISALLVRSGSVRRAIISSHISAQVVFEGQPSLLIFRPF